MATSDETLAEFTRGVIEAVQDMIDRVLTLSNDVAERVAETVQSAIPDDLIANARRKLSDQFPGSTHCAPPVTAAAPAKKAPAKKAPAKKAPAKKAPAKKAPAKKAPAKKAPAKKAPAKKAPAKKAPAKKAPAKKAPAKKAPAKKAPAKKAPAANG